MAVKICSISLVVFLCVSSIGARIQLFQQDSELDSSSSSSADVTNGICKNVVEPHGYACQEYKVTTSDGYILSVQRIPAGRTGNSTNTMPVLLQHGLFVDAVSWMLNSPDKSLAYILADNGFDVWLANSRGTNYSLGHTSLNPSDPAYWNWSWDELVAYDLPATVQLVYNQTGQKLHYVGHSLGALIGFGAFSRNELVVDTIRSAAMLSPVAYLSHINSTLAKTGADAFGAELLNWIGIEEFTILGQTEASTLENLCKKPNNNCSDLLTPFTGPNCCINSSKTDEFLQHEPQSTSTKNMIHLAQMVRQGTFAMYDYGSADENKKYYGQTTPPMCNISSIPNGLPLFLAYGGQDYLTDIIDVKTLLHTLKDHNADKLVVQCTEIYAHADFIFGDNANQLVYDPVMAFFRSF